MSQRDPQGQGRWSRRVVLRGAGVALCLPFFQSLASRSARAAAVEPRTRFLPIFLPNGAPERWRPLQVGAGGSWALSSVLEPLTPLKSRVTVISGLENASVFRADGLSSVEPPPRQTGAWLTCVDGKALRAEHPELGEVNGVSADQVIAAAIGSATPLPSLQLGLSTVDSYCDGEPCSVSRSVSFDAAGKALYKVIDPKQAFKLLAGALPGGYAPGLVSKQARSSVLDSVLESAKVVQRKLGRHDQRRLEEFLASVRQVEAQLDEPPSASCPLPPEPIFPEVLPGYQTNTATYDKSSHADLMNQLIALAFQCDLTRVISYMLEDERSEFSYSHVQRRVFGETTSTPIDGVCGGYHSAMTGNQDDYASITRWNVSKVSELCQRLAQVEDSDGSSLLDNSVVFFGAATHGNNYACEQLPAVLIGGGAGKLSTDQHIDLLRRPMRDLYFTLMNGIFQLDLTDFGMNRMGAPLAIIDELV